MDTIVFRDESRFNLSSDDNRVCVWRPRGEGLNPAFALQRHTAPTAAALRSPFSTRQCSALQRELQDCLRTVTTLPWPARSPDLSLIEHIWDHLGQRVGNPMSLNELEASLSSDFHRILIWRERGSRNHPSNIIERDRYGGRGVLVWGGIMLGSRTDLHIFDAGSVNGTRYCHEILLPYSRLFRGAMGLQFLFMDDNAPCHRTVAAEQLLESEDIERMDWPSHRACMGFSRQTLGSSYLTTSNDSGASIGAARRMGSNA
ncbi:transposable element Tcb2 transposase [Trichonephila clavipes]|nr:transposable element Tcb2 transposase [Trichonephila clavipes]